MSKDKQLGDIALDRGESAPPVGREDVVMGGRTMKRTQLSAALVLFVLALTLSPSWALAQDSEFQETLSRAEQGDASAQYNLGQMYEDGEGVPQDLAEAAKWWRKAAEQGHASAQFDLGYAYKRGRGVPHDGTEAVAWYRRAAEHGETISIQAAQELGFMYRDGDGVPENIAEAVKWYRLAAEQGHASAQFNLGVMYGNGRGVPEDYVRAYAWFNLAAAQGSEASEIGKNNLRQRMTADQIARAQELSTTLFERINKSQSAPP